MGFKSKNMYFYVSVIRWYVDMTGNASCQLLSRCISFKDMMINYYYVLNGLHIQ